jgi:hypothetical protein
MNARSEKVAEDKKLILAKGLKVPTEGSLIGTIESFDALNGTTKDGILYSNMWVNDGVNNTRFLVKEGKAILLIAKLTGFKKSESEDVTTYISRTKAHLSGIGAKVEFEETEDGITGFVNADATEATAHTYTGKRLLDVTSFSYAAVSMAKLMKRIENIPASEQATIIANYQTKIDIAKMNSQRPVTVE